MSKVIPNIELASSQKGVELKVSFLLVVWDPHNLGAILKLPFLAHLPPTITPCHVFSREPSGVTLHSEQTNITENHENV